MPQVLTCPNCGSTAEIGEGVESGQFVCARCKSTVGFGPGTSLVLSRTDIDDELTGERLGGYEVRKLLGAGGMGKVYLARQVSIDRLVALKILAPRLARNENFTRRFIREAQAAGKLLHPNLVTVFDAGMEGATYYFSMEYVRGEPVSKLVFEKGKLAPAEALGIVRQVAEALEAALEHGIIHRDIKPDNILLTYSGQVKLADLGLAKQIEGDEGQTGLTVAGSVMGTPHYLAPEQARNTKDVDQRADIYSLGCTLYHMLIGKVPFTGSSTYEILRKHETEQPVFAPDCGVPAQVQALVRDMMAKDAADRPQRPADVIARIDGVLAGLSTGAATAPPPSVAAMPTEPASRVPTPVPPAPTPPAESAARRSSTRWVIALTIVLAVLAVGFVLLATYQKARIPADMFEKARQYAQKNPQDTEGILRRYNNIATEHEGTEWAHKAKQAILGVPFNVEDALRKGRGELNHLIERLRKIQENTPDTDFAAKLGEKIEELRESYSNALELDFRRLRDDIENLLRQGKFGEAKVRVKVYPEQKGMAELPASLQQFTERTFAMAELNRLAGDFYKAAFEKDWDKALKYIDPAQLGDENRKKAIKRIGTFALGWSRARNYRVTRIEVSVPEGKARVHGQLTVTRGLPGERAQTRDVQVANQAVLRDGRWYLRLGEEDKKPSGSKPRLPRRPLRDRPRRRPIRK